MQILSVQIDKPFVRTALLHKNGRGLKIYSLKSALLSNPDDVKSLYISHFKGRLISGLLAKDLFFRPMELKIANLRHAEEALAFQSEGTCHLNPADTITVPHFIKKKPGHIEALLFTTSKQLVKAHMKELDQLQVNLDCLSSHCLGLFRYARWRAPDLKDAFLVDLGSSEWLCLWIEQGQLKKSYSLGIGTEALLAALWEDRKKTLPSKEIENIAQQIDLQQLQPQHNSHLFAKLNEMRQELGRAILSFHRVSLPRPVVFTGHTNVFKKLPEFLVESFAEAVVSVSSDFFDKEEKKYAIAIGLTLEQIKAPLQLLQREFFPKKHWKRAGLYGLILTSLSILLSSSMFYIGRHILMGREVLLRESVQAILLPWGITEQEKSLPNALNRWMRLIEVHGKEYPYVFRAQRVAEVLSWLAAHSVLKEFEAEKDPIDIRRIEYQLLEAPKIGCVHANYQAKLELEFQLKSPMHARRFHEVLLKESRMIDMSRDIDWEVLNDGYRASFILNNLRTPYVP